MVTTNCVVTSYFCNTALKVYTKYTPSQVQNNGQNNCNSSAVLSIAEYTCTDNQYISTPSGSTSSSTVNLATPSAMALGNSIHAIWFGLLVIILLLSISVGTYIYKK